MRMTRQVGLSVALALTALSMVAVVMALAAVALLLPGTNHTAEAGGMWFGWVYGPQTNSFIRVYEDGTSQEYNLNLAAGESLGSSPSAFAPNGEWLGLCTYQESPQDPNQQTPYVRVHSFNPDADAKGGFTFPVMVPLAPGVQCNVARDAFDVMDQTRMAYSQINYYAYDPGADLSKPAWEISVLNVTTGQVIYALNEHTPGAEQMMWDDSGRWSLMPYVHHFEGDQILLELIPWGTEFMPGQHLFLWDITTNALTPVASTTHPVDAVVNVATGERVWVAENPNFPAATPLGPMPSYNVVMYQHPTMAEAVPIYHDATRLPVSPTWVKGGEAIVFHALPGFEPSVDPANLSAEEWTLLDRTGTAWPLKVPTFTHNIVGLRDGFVTWESNYETWTATMTRYQYGTGPTPDSTTVLFTTDDPNWSLVWSVPQPTGGDAMQFPAVTP